MPNERLQYKDLSSAVLFGSLQRGTPKELGKQQQKHQAKYSSAVKGPESGGQLVRVGQR